MELLGQPVTILDALVIGEDEPRRLTGKITAILWCLHLGERQHLVEVEFVDDA